MASEGRSPTSIRAQAGGIEQLERVVDDVADEDRLRVDVDRAHRDPRRVGQGVDQLAHLLGRVERAVERLGQAVHVGRRLADPARREHERRLDQRDRLADVVDRRGEELLADGLDALGQGGQGEHGRAVERVVDEGDRGDDVADREVVVEEPLERSRDLLAEEPELGRDRDRPQPLLEPHLGMRPRAGLDRVVVHRRVDLVAGRRRAGEQVHDGVEQGGDVVGDRAIRMVPVERLAAGRGEPRVEDRLALAAQCLGDGGEVGGRGDLLDARVDVGRGLIGRACHAPGGRKVCAQLGLVGRWDGVSGHSTRAVAALPALRAGLARIRKPPVPPTVAARRVRGLQWAYGQPGARARSGTPAPGARGPAPRAPSSRAPRGRPGAARRGVAAGGPAAPAGRCARS